MGCLVSGKVGGPDDLTPVVQATRGSERASKSTQVQHSSMAPQERIDGRNSSGRVRSGTGERDACDLTTLVQKCRGAVGTSEGTQVPHGVVFP